MGKISQVAAKYIIHASINIEGVVDKPDIIGAVFGQTEGLLGSDLELRELQRNGRIGRIEVTSEVHSGKTSGTILIPSSLDKAETCIIGAALEIIQRIGPCNATVKVLKIEDVRISKRNQVVGRAKELLKHLMDNVMPDSQEIAEEVSQSVRVMEITEYGKDRLPAGPGVEESEDIIIVEGRADVLSLLKSGFKNAIAMNGTSVPPTLVELAKQKAVTVFVDGDRGGDLIIRELSSVAEIDFVTKAPDGKEVEELTKKEINKALRSRIAFEQLKMDLKPSETSKKPTFGTRPRPTSRPAPRSTSQRPARPASPRPARREFTPRTSVKKATLNAEEKKTFKDMAEELIGTRGAAILDEKLNILGKVPLSELEPTIKSLNTGMYAVVFDGEVNSALVNTAEKSGIKHIIGMDSKVKTSEKTNIITVSEL
ncbi:DNA primase [Candidatus Woesearchaeota archaeon]|jgi:DNA primase|nr:DNA primase [Candidatus Woesearchaeota archaeon]MBT4368800.1 DNA primase [Candidatus Woesearchaeota archaeon]MBT4712089.1 DNA primase [Candidatus Woesearchaeota archaeon]MBT6639163.1 DNA primase [Candidatus Woesearchaeota archaeon]MBT7134363.1 DNA primase [Candidatus Woesearchaeota archaeon]